MARINAILAKAAEDRVSDIHFSAEERIWMRLDGDLVPMDEKVYSPEELELLLFEILSDKERDKLKTSKNLDKSHAIEGVGNFRVNMFYTRRGVGSVIRTLPSKMPTLEQLGLPEVIKSLAELPKGLILVTGPTGSGKSTTLAAIINHMNSNFPYHILTAEDPVEFIHPSKKSLINQREIGHSCPTFAEALKYALREDPDVILVGEMRDLETINLALTAAETGHLVLGTLHTRGAAPTVDRIIESFPAMQQPMVRAMLAESLQAVISQTLVKKAGGKGRVAAYEIMVMNYAISNLVREGKTFQIASAIQTGKREGMILMENHLRELATAGEISKEDADAVIASISRGQANKNAPNSGGAQPPAMGGSAPPSMPMKQAATPNVPTPGYTSMPAPPMAVAPPPQPTMEPEAPAPTVPARAPVPAATATSAPTPPHRPTPAASAASEEKASQKIVHKEAELISLEEISGLSDLAEIDLETGELVKKGPPVLRPAMKFKPLDAAAVKAAAAAKSLPKPAPSVEAAAPAAAPVAENPTTAAPVAKPPAAKAPGPKAPLRPIPGPGPTTMAAPPAPAKPAAVAPPKPAPAAPKAPVAPPMPPAIKKTG